MQSSLPCHPLNAVNAFMGHIAIENFDKTAISILTLSGIVTLNKRVIHNCCWQDYFMNLDHYVFARYEIDENAK
ncbi:MAG: hypothetical protein I8H74_01865 [Moraxellaceae bacterium]|nr:hypothetical protein [Moraxellaceae bacterium]